MKRPGRPVQRTELKRGRRRRRTELEQAASRRWHDAVVGREGITLGSLTEPELSVYVVQAHHIVTQQRLRRQAADREVDPAVLLWDVRVGMHVTARRHERHHSRVEPITWEELERHAPAVFGFALEWGLEEWLVRHYPSGAPVL